MSPIESPTTPSPISVSFSTQLPLAETHGVISAWNIINEILTFLICIVGIFGNFTAIALIESLQHLKRLQSNVFLSALALLSNLFLTTLFLLRIERYIPNFHVYNSDNVAGCKILTYLAHFADFTCVWLIVFVALDRVMVLQFPLLRHRAYDRVSARKLTFILILLAGLLNVWLLVVAHPIKNDEDGETTWFCAVQNHHVALYTSFNSFETVLSIIVPSILIICSNSLTVYKLHRYRQQNIICTPRVRFVDLGKPTTTTKPTYVLTEHTEGALPERDASDRLTDRRMEFGTFLAPSQAGPKSSLISQPTGSSVYSSVRMDADEGTEVRRRHAFPLCGIIRKFRQHLEHHLSKFSSKKEHKILRPSDLQLLKTMLIVTTVFLFLNIPSYLCRLFLTGNGALEVIIWQVSYLLYHSHHAVMFYLYVFNSRQMRKELKPAAIKLLECYCLKTVPEFGHETQSKD